jgi:hypothetical protein
VVENRREEQKLWLILFQIRGTRARLNFLALQHGFFTTAAVLVVGAAMVWAAATRLGPLAFLITSSLVIVGCLIALVSSLRVSYRGFTNQTRAAEIADSRSGLKGRLLTVLALAERPVHSPLWSYLIEDTYGLRENFTPERVEPRWLARSFYGFLAACLSALLIIPYALVHAPGFARQMAMSGQSSQVTADIGNLDIRPGDPALEPNAEIYADQATMRRLQQKLAAAQGDVSNGGLSRWMNKARDWAGGLQDKITGQQKNRHSPLRLKLTDNGADSSHDKDTAKPNPSANNNQSAQNKSGASSGQNRMAGKGAQQQPPLAAVPGNQADQMAQGGLSSIPGQPGPNQDESANKADTNAGVPGSSGGANHGVGTDPQHLFGPVASQPVGSSNFRITIDAEQSDESSTPGAPAYVPPKVRVPLNSNQFPDEPLARASVPAGDQLTIKRVFER